MKYSKIAGTGSYLPPRIFTNADWEERVETSDAWIIERTGIQSRHIGDENETTSNMATQAAIAAMAQADCSPQDIQMIIVATGTSDKVFPATSCVVQSNLNIPTCVAFDIGAACSGFIYALSIADQFIKSGAYKTILVIGAELMSRVIDWTDRNTCVLFGDGAGAVVLRASESPGILSTDLYAQGSYGDLLSIDNAQMGDHSNRMVMPLKGKTNNIPLESLYPFVRMNGPKVFKLAVTKLDEMVRDLQIKHDLKPEQIDWLIPHQANIRIIQATADKLGIGMDKVICTVQTHSNTSSASIPLALDTAVRDGRVKRGQTLLLEAFGAGLTWGSALIKY